MGDPPSHQQGETALSTRSKVAGVAGALLIAATSVTGVFASSHREAPLIAGDPAADNTDLYAFVSPNDTNSLTIIANYVPLEEPAGGPNFFPFDPAVKLHDQHRQQRQRQGATSGTTSGSRRIERPRTSPASRRSSTTTARSRA